MVGADAETHVIVGNHDVKKNINIYKAEKQVFGDAFKFYTKPAHYVDGNGESIFIFLNTNYALKHESLLVDDLRDALANVMIKVRLYILLVTNH